MIPGGRQVIGVKDIFVWDSHSSNTTPTNIDLWQQIYNSQLQTDCIVLVKSETGNTYDAIFIIPRNLLPVTQSDYTIYSVPQTPLNSTSDSSTSSGIRSKITKLTTNNGTVTKITDMINSDSVTGTYLRADYNYSIPYTPLYEGSPTTKKYVDDTISQNVFDNLFIINNTDIAYTHNIALWDNLYTKQKTKECYLITSTTNKQIPLIFFIGKDSLTNTTSTTKEHSIYSTPYNLQSLEPSTSYSQDGLYKALLQIQVTNNKITLVKDIQTSVTYGGPYLSASSNYSTPFIPTNNGQPTSKKYVDDLIIVGTESDASDNTKIIFDENDLEYVTDVVNSLSGNEVDKSPSVAAVNQKLAELTTQMETYITLYNDTTGIGTAGTITLKENPMNYNTLKIIGYVINTDSSIGSSFVQEIYPTNQGKSKLCSIGINILVSNTLYTVSELLTLNTNKTITRGDQKMFNNGSFSNVNINIVTVLGYKRTF